MNQAIEKLKERLAHKDRGIRAIGLMDVHAMLPQIMALWESVDQELNHAGGDLCGALASLNARAAEVLGVEP